MPLLLLLVFIAVPIAELYVIIQVGQAIGVLPTIALLLADAILGTILMRSQGRAAWRRFNAALAEGRVPGREVFDGTLVILGGAFLLTPGFLTDIIGVLFLLPPTRAVMRRLIMRTLGSRFRVAVAAPGAAAKFARGRRGRPGASPPPDYDVDATARDVDRRELP